MNPPIDEYNEPKESERKSFKKVILKHRVGHKEDEINSIVSFWQQRENSLLKLQSMMISNETYVITIIINS